LFKRLSLLALLAALPLGLLLAGCGGGDGNDEETDAQQVLEDTFSSDASVDSAVLEISLNASAEGEDGGAVEGTVSGPFEADPEGGLPQLGLVAQASVSAGASLDFDAGLTITEDAAYIGFGGEEYEVDPATFEQFQAAYEQSAAQQQEAGEESDALFESLGIDPSGWLTDVTNEGTEEIDGTETVHISGAADIGRLLADAQELASNTGQSEELRQGDVDAINEAVEEARIDLWSGTDDNILRRFQLTLVLGPLEGEGAGAEGANVELTINLSEVNEEQEFEAPENPRPLSELGIAGIGELEGGDLPDLDGGGGSGGGGGGSGGAGGAGGGGSGGGGGVSDEYFDCAAQAETPEDLAACANP
jgi:hypothetical protein